MRILFLNRPDALTRWGGDTTQMMQTKTALEQLGVSVTIELTSTPPTDGYDLAHVFNVQTAPSSVKQIRHARESGLPIVLSPIYWDRRHIDQWCETYQFHQKSIVRSLAALNPRLPAFYFNNISRARKELPHLICEMLDCADYVLPNSIAELETLCLLFNRADLRGRSSVVVNAIETSLDGSKNSAPMYLPKLPQEEFILQVGRFEPIKGQRSLIRALGQTPEIPIVFVGSNLESPYGRVCRDLGEKRGNTWFIAHLPHDQLPYVYSQAKVHALPSMRESPGLVTLEAALHGANCVVSIHSPLQEYFESLAWVCDPSNDKSIRAAVMQAWAAPRNGNLGDRVRTQFTWAHAASQTMAAYVQVLKRGRN
jgi:glycosyltransferase involved in cell wall biosynthesis